MEHFWRSFEGYFTFPDFYAWVAAQMPADAKMVEVGVYTGQSAAFMGVELINRGIGATLDLVDRFTDGGSAEEVADRLEPVTEAIGSLWVGCSWELAAKYEDASLDFCFIDAAHDYASVSRDIDAWAPKVKPGGILAGHDFADWPGFGVMRAVCERFPRFEVWPGITDGGDAQMKGRYWPVWMVRR
ncbi:MAG TPA: class I SAM-dependent methyltransferase [Candidatus Dormibacteraeota bacterium]|nr:class I SAM-dependent methyltransferase [Candidatus Dormibacteraeota bacterium]